MVQIRELNETSSSERNNNKISENISVKISLYNVSTPFLVLNKLKGIRGVRLENRNVFSTPGPRTKYFERFFHSLVFIYVTVLLH